MDGGAWWATVHGVTKSRTRLSNFTFTFHFHALEKETATHSSVLAWRIPGTGEPGGLPSMGSHRVGHDWSDLAAAAANFLGYKLIKGTNEFPAGPLITSAPCNDKYKLIPHSYTALTPADWILSHCWQNDPNTKRWVDINKLKKKKEPGILNKFYIFLPFKITADMNVTDVIFKCLSFWNFPTC